MGSQRFTVHKHEKDSVLLAYLADQLKVSRTRAKSLLDQRLVFVNQRRVWMAKHRLRGGDVVEVDAEQPDPRKADLSIVYQSPTAIVINKPANLLSNGTLSAESLLRLQLNLPGLVAVHRLDRHTTGCNLFATSDESLDSLVEAFRCEAVQKVYRAIVHGRPAFQRRTFDQRLDGRSAVTHVQVQQTMGDATLVRVRIETGRTHQIRRHLAQAGHPVVGDPQHGRQQVERSTLRLAGRPMLHAESISLLAEASHETIEAFAPVPSDMQGMLRTLRSRSRT